MKRMFPCHFPQLLAKRKRFLTAILIVGLIFMLHQFTSMKKLGQEFSRKRQSQFKTNFKAYEKADDLQGFFVKNGNGADQALDKNAPHRPKPGRVMPGILQAMESRYFPDALGQFRCLESNEVIPFAQVNDDYCDCKDGSDEPSTPSCPENRFFCSRQPADDSAPVFVPSSRVNDGICDCCDGSDEWRNVAPSAEVKISKQMQEKLGVFQVPCQYRCKY